MFRPSPNFTPVEGGDQLCICGFCLKSECEAQAFVSLEEQPRLIWHRHQSFPLDLPANIRFANGLVGRCDEPQSGPTSRSDTVHELVTLGLPWPSV